MDSQTVVEETNSLELEISDKMLTEECRACLQKCDKQKAYNLFEAWFTPWAVQGAIIADDLSRFADVEILEFDKFSKVICPKCYQQLSDACTFMITVQMSDNLMRQQADKNGVASNTDIPPWPQPILINKSGDLINNMEVEVKQEVLSEDEDASKENDAALNMDQDWEPMMDIKIEPEEITAPVQYNALVNGTLDETDEMANKNHSSVNHHEQEEYLNDPIKEEPLSGDDVKEAALDLPLDCILCLKSFNSVSGLKAHVISQHSYGAVKRKSEDSLLTVSNKVAVKSHICSTCEQSFSTLTDLMVHRTSHSEHVCFVCDRKFNSFQQLMRHGARCQKKTARRGQLTRPSRPKQLLQPVKNITSQKKLHTKTEDTKMNNKNTSTLNAGAVKLPKLVNSLSSLKHLNTKSQNKPDKAVKNTHKIRQNSIQKRKHEFKAKNDFSEHGSKVFAERIKRKIDVKPIIKNVPKSIQNRKTSTPKVEIRNRNKSENEEQILNNVAPTKIAQDVQLKEIVKSSRNPETVKDLDKHLTANDLVMPEFEFKNITIQFDETTCNVEQDELSHVETNTSNSEHNVKPPKAVSSFPKDEELIAILTDASNDSVEHLVSEESDTNENVKTEKENSSKVESKSNIPEEKSSSTDELSAMKVHLAINPLNKDNAFETETNIENMESDKSESSEPKLVKMIYEQSDI